MPRSGIIGSNGGSIPIFLRNLHTDLQSGCTSLQSHQQGMSVPVSPYPCQHLLLLVLLIIAILTRVRRNLWVVLICISLIASDVEHFFMYLLTDCISSSVKCLFSSLAHLLIGLFVFLVFSFSKSSYILEINALSEVHVVKIFSQSVRSLFTLMIASFAEWINKMLYMYIFDGILLSFKKEWNFGICW